jgi:tRNA threonylcarbamoyladenosine biosynthesis protein TsaB
MTSLLAIETSGPACSVAISVDGALRTSVEIIRPNVHDAVLADLVRQVCAWADVDISKLSMVAVSSGPGSFTGLRIGVSMAKGLCAASSAKLISVPTTTALLHASTEVAQRSGAARIACIIPSHQNLYYVAVSPVSDPAHLAPVELLAEHDIKGLDDGQTLFVGPGADLLDPTPVSGLTRHSGRFVAFAAWRLIEAGHQPVDPMTFAPEYHQDFRPR